MKTLLCYGTAIVLVSAVLVSTFAAIRMGWELREEQDKFAAGMTDLSRDISALELQLQESVSGLNSKYQELHEGLLAIATIAHDNHETNVTNGSSQSTSPRDDDAEPTALALSELSPSDRLEVAAMGGTTHEFFMKTRRGTFARISIHRDASQAPYEVRMAAQRVLNACVEVEEFLTECIDSEVVSGRGFIVETKEEGDELLKSLQTPGETWGVFRYDDSWAVVNTLMCMESAEFEILEEMRKAAMEQFANFAQPTGVLIKR